MSWTSNLLVIAHRTIDSERLLQELSSRAVAGPIRVTLLVPAHPGRGRVSTARRMDRAVRRLEAEDITVDAQVGHPNPIVALDEIWDPYRFDEIIVATLPVPGSRWRSIALAHRIERFTGFPVTPLVAPVWEASRTLRVHA